MNAARQYMRPCYEYSGIGNFERAMLAGFSAADVDGDLLPIDMLRGLSRVAPQEPGIYFLWRGPQLVYIGATMTDLDARTYFHYAAMRGMRLGEAYPHTHYTCQQRKLRGLRELEYRYIEAYRPPFNSRIADKGDDRRVPVTRDDLSFTPSDADGGKHE